MTFRLHNNLKVLATAAVVATQLIVGQVMPANAALSQVGPINPNTGFPAWYRDTNGLALDLMEAADPFSLSDPVNPANPFSQQIGFNAEGFYWMAEASVSNAAGTQNALLVLAMEAAFAGEQAVDGEQSAFGRIRYRVDGLTSGETYQITHPYATVSQVADAAGVINVTSDIGGFGIPGFPANFNIPLASGIGPFLTWDTFVTNPALPNDPALINPVNPTRRYVGNPNVPHAVTGGPNGNSFTVTGPNANLSTNLFTVVGRVALEAPTVTVNTQTATTATPAVTGTVSDPTATVSVVVNGQAPINATVNPDGTWTATVATALANGAYDVAVTATNAGGTGNDATTNELTVNVTGAPVDPGTVPTTPTTPTNTTPTTTTPTGPVSITDKGFARIQKGGGLFITDTNVPSTIKVFYGTTSKRMKANVTDGATGTHHEINFTTLRPGKVYYFKVVAQGTDGSQAQSQIIKLRVPRR